VSAANDIAQRLSEARTALDDPTQLGLATVSDRHIFAIEAIDQAINLLVDDNCLPRLFAIRELRTVPRNTGPGPDSDPED
jgi:hypothetical protein